ncbi:MAG: NrtA/SsuA/CpmA family ABC transporter substrate-binding protein [Nitrospirae bacterium]|nr:NrtA/SsuA/CpmA family ABC transporter substrate-binding protein [Nitrospirota bacterium]
MAIVRKITVMLLVMTALAVAASCKDRAPQAAREKITLAAYTGSYGFLPFIAQEKGFYADNGLDVVINEFDFGLKAADALLAGKADIATAADFVLTSYSFDHDDIRAIGSIARSLTVEIVVRKDRGIERPVDLKGRKVGVSSKTKGEFFLARFLILNGMDFQDIKVKYLEPARIVDAFSKGTIDAASIWEPFISEIKQRLGTKAENWPAQSNLAFYFLLLSREKWVKEHPAAIERFLKAMVQAEEFTKKNPQEAQQIISRRFKLEPSFVQAIWQKNDFTVEMPQQLLLLMEEGARLRIKNRLTDRKEIPDYLDFVYTDGLKKVKPEAVTIIR